MWEDGCPRIKGRKEDCGRTGVKGGNNGEELRVGRRIGRCWRTAVGTAVGVDGNDGGMPLVQRMLLWRREWEASGACRTPCKVGRNELWSGDAMQTATVAGERDANRESAAAATAWWTYHEVSHAITGKM